MLYTFFEVSQETKREMTLQLTIWFISNVYSLHTAASVASGLKQKCPAQPGYFPFFPGVGGCTVELNPMHLSGNRLIGLVTFTILATTTLLYL